MKCPLPIRASSPANNCLNFNRLAENRHRNNSVYVRRKVVQLFETDECGIDSPLPDDVGGCRVVGNTIGPGAKRAPVIESGEAAPEGKVEFLQQVAALLRIEFVGCC